MLLHKKSGESLPQEEALSDGNQNIPSVSVDEEQGSQALPCRNNSNFMHDPSTVLTKEGELNKKSKGIEPISVQGVPPESGRQLLLVNSPPFTGSAGRRKVSLMPLVTEEDLRKSNMGHKDPVSVAQVFGEDFASKFCVLPLTTVPLFSPEPIPNPGMSAAGPPSHSPLPYDCKEKMLRRRLSPENTLLPFEIRDKSMPEGVPTVKVRRKPMSLNLVTASEDGGPFSAPYASDEAYEDVAVALSPVQLKFPSLPASMFSSSAVQDLLFPPFSYSSTKPDFFVDLDIAASHPDMVHFQQVLNDWIKKQSKVMGSAFLMVSSEHNTTYCQVCGNVLLEEPINFGGSDLLANLFSLSQQPDQGEQVSAVAPVLDLAKLLANQQNSLPPKLCSNLEFLLQELSASQPTTGLGSSLASLIGIRARCGFVAALVLAHSSNQNRWEELNIVLPHMPVLSTLMSMVANVEEQKRLAHQSQVFLSMTQNVFSSLQDMNLLVRNITKEAKALVQAEICSLFLLDKEHSELVAEVFEKNGTSDEYLTEIRMPLTQGIVGHVATTGQMMNVKEVYNHPYFYPKVDERTGFVTRNILCFPIKDSQGNLVGVAELCNKIGKSSFTKHDEQIATTFAVYCAISISHCLLYRKLQEAHRRSHMAAELLVQGSTLSIAPEDILRLTVREIPPPTSFHAEFNGFHFVPRSIGTGDTYVEASLSMFKELGFIDKYRLRRRTLARFLLMVQKGYRDVPYHNWSHAFAVGHFCYLLIRMPAVMDALNDLERFSLLVACLCHDIDHRGTTNAFQLQSKTPLAQLYSSEGSVLERHHFAQTVTILGMDECNIFEQLTRQQYQTVLDSIREIILATDIAAHLRKVNRIKQMVDDGYDAKSPDHHYLLMCLLMTASDLSDQSKDFKNSKGIAENIYKEFFSQGDLEKQMGNRPIEMMDRERACVPKIQLEFMDTVALPVFDYISQMLPDLSSTYESLVTNRCCWSTLDNILQEEGLPSGGLDYLKDIELEKRVMQRIDKTRPPQFGNIHEPAEPVGNEQKEEKEEKQSTTQKPEGLAKSNSSKPPASSSNKRPKLPKSLAKPKT